MGLSPRFFKLGWGGQSLEILREFIEKNLDMLQSKENTLPWPPAIVQPRWRTIWETRRAVLQEGVFPTPVDDELKELLPPESHMARVRLLMPRSSLRQEMACVLHLAGTGDHGFDMRLKLGGPLLEQGVATMVLESPFYGKRRPVDQKGSRLRYVSDLLALGRTTIEESRSLLHWAREDMGFGKLGICGLSMGGVHASMVGSLHPYPIAVTPLLAPHSAAVAFCEGVLSLTTDWDVLARDTTLSKAFTSRVNVQPTANFASASPPLSSEVRAATDNHTADPIAQGPTPSNFASSVSAKSLNGSIELPAKYSGVEALNQTSERVSSNQGSGSRDSDSGSPEPSSGILNLEDELASEEAASVAVAAVAAGYSLEETRARLQEVLSLTDVTRFPCPEKAEAVILVAATNDAYIPQHSVERLQKAWPGMEVRWVVGGHVSSYLLHSKAFRQAIVDSLSRI
ncbi:hypothetical protein KFL_005540060 [Klebsormidium nitens]|uniref:Uncharacterized protein n=1 Tax=Klebsormidium nitens TaxID=105231 RepID=A0A1Y1IKP3_KLENI|nr:hypothetical protein KFL_005540060 [Klebsormidium nitens]|eukprot:GAQ89711.1 hypothetical protein KFL_005540060 [Klebsormidium nitens]